MIPKKIHLCWLSGDNYPDLIEKCILSWKIFLPDYEIFLWDTKAFPVSKVRWVEQAFESKKYAFAADYIRLYALYNYGGIYLDADVQVMKSFNDLLHHESFMGTEFGGDLEPAIIGSKKGSPWIKKCMDYYEGQDFIDNNGVMNLKPLPIVMYEILQKNYSISLKKNQTILFFSQIGLTLYPSEYFSPKSLHTNKVVNSQLTYSIHHFDGNWINKGFVYRIKKLIHLTIILLIGHKRHVNVVKFIRKIIG